MMSRGRHRRRNRGRALRAALAGTALALTAAATIVSASQANVGKETGALKPLASAADTDPLRLQEDLVPERTLDRLADEMGKPVGVGAVLDSADHTLRTASGCTAAERTALPVEPAATRAYCWDEADTLGWQPGAVTSSGDADDDGWWGGNRAILSGWSRSDASGASAAGAQGLARVAFVDANDLGRLSYTWALLAVPVDGGRDYRALASRVSGMVWYQDKLLVTADGGNGTALYVYDMDRIQRTTVTSAAVGRVRGGWSAHGNRWVLPAVASYRLTGGACDPATDTGVPCLGGISLDRSSTPDSLAVSERAGTDGDRPTRLWRYSFSTDPERTGLLATDPAGRVRADEAYRTKTPGIGGVLSHQETGAARADWYLAGTGAGRGTLWRQNGEDARATECGADETHRCWSAHTASLSYWEALGEIWSQSGRVLFALPLASVDRSLG
ncbi:hypothetical protein QQY66_39540 [Streptomyces sp. DG2A-72]|uniref:hypothetical protein n=1 Tax=Streptomyces sp. DG2A-72 TaxID=3051386 RepID=UPI00265BFAFC|nr:hypothetical protein [Streptomyces sp. DG2A-72]MDO0937530.1 hypothetical protein [Streptomyces sp. DG2A-72]